MKRFCLSFVLALLSSVAVAVSDAERNNSSEMNAAKDVGAVVAATGGVRVLFLGNSITLHGPAPKIGWTNNWGMAASCAENDFVHIVTRGIEAKTGRKADVRVRNVADFERKFATWTVYPAIQELIDFDADYVVFAIGENTADLQTEAERLVFRDAVKRFFALFAQGRKKPHVVVRGVCWPSDWKDACLSHAASDLAFTFVKADFGNLWGMDDWGRHWHSGVARHPGDAGMAAIAGAILDGFFPKDSGFAAWVDDRPVEVRPILVSRQPFNQWAPGYQRPADQTETAGLLRFETEGACRLSVRQTPQRCPEDPIWGKVRPTTNILVRPLSAGVKPSVDKDGVISFTLPKPGYYALEIDGLHRPLEIFAQPKRDFAKERAEANVVFGPGLHEPVVVKLKSHDRVYIDKDAVVYGSFQADGVEDVKVSGYGIICGERNRREGNACYREGMDGAVRIIDSKNVTFDGPTVLDSCCWCVAAFNSSDLALRNLKVTGAWRYNTDGIDICNSQRVKVENCYVHSFDDALVIKGISHDYVESKKVLSLDFPRNEAVEDITFSNCVCWCGWGRTLEIGLETWAKHFRGIVFEDCDLIHNNGVALSVHLGGPAVVEDATYRNIRIECDGSEENPVLQTNRAQKVTCTPGYRSAWLGVENVKMFGNGYYATKHDFSKEPCGTIRRLTVDNISIRRTNGAPEPRKYVNPEPGTSFGTITVTNVMLDGVPLSQETQLVPGGTFRSGTVYQGDGRDIHVYEKDVRTVDDVRYHHLEHDKPIKTAFFLQGLKDVTLDFGGATVVLHGKYQPFILDRCTNVTIRNVTVKFSRSPFTEGEVVSSTARQLVLKVDKTVFPYDLKDGNCYFRGDTWVNTSAPRSSFLQFFDGTTRRGAGMMLAAVGKDAKINAESPWAKHTLRMIPSERDGLLVLDASRDHDTLKAAKPGMHAVLAHESRSQSNCMMVESRDVTLENYRILNGHGMGIYSFHTHNITLDRLRLEYDKASPGFVANHADGIHAFGTSGDYVIRDSVVEGTIDDTLNIHSNFYELQSAEKNRLVAFTCNEPYSTTPLFEPGDRIRVTRGRTLEPIGEYVILRTEPIDKKHVAFVVDRPVAKHEKGDTIENLSTQCRIRITNSRFGRVNSHMRFQTRGEVVVENTELDLPVLLTGDMNFWYESSPCEKVIFRNVAFKGERGRVRVTPKFFDTAKNPYYHGKVRFENCTFESSNPVDAEYAEEIVMENCRNTAGREMSVKVTNCGTVIVPGCKVVRKTLPYRTTMEVTY